MIRENEVRSGMRSAMALFSNPTKRGKLWSRTDAIRAKRTKEKVAEVVQNYREKQAAKNAVAPVRFTNIKKVKNGWHATGWGFVQTENFADLKITLKLNGYTHFRMGGLKFSL